MTMTNDVQTQSPSPTFSTIVDMESNKRTWTLPSGNKLNFERRDPYGFWSIHYDKGQVPAALKGNYTTYEQAKAAADRYLTEQAIAEKEKEDRYNHKHPSRR
jgi:hypothetical protein